MIMKSKNWVKVEVPNAGFRMGMIEENTKKLLELVKNADQQTSVLLFPELSLTGASCGDLFLQKDFLKRAEDMLPIIEAESRKRDVLFTVGLPIRAFGRTTDVLAIFHRGLVALVGKVHLNEELFQSRHFDPAIPEEFETGYVDIAFEEEGHTVRIGFYDDLDGGWQDPGVPSLQLLVSGTPEIWSTQREREQEIRVAARKSDTQIILANGSDDESTTDHVFRHSGTSSDGTLVSRGNVFYHNPYLFHPVEDAEYTVSMREKTTEWKEKVDPFPFLPKDPEDAKRILELQAEGVLRRLDAIGAKKAVLGLSGGLDSTLALLVLVEAFDKAGRNREDIHVITMPGFGTTDRTYQNALKMANLLGVTLKEIPIADAVRQHFKDIGWKEGDASVVYENAQARERTQILMDYGNLIGAPVIGTGDLSELALGWATYNGDHMSMYSVNASVPKTLVRYLVWEAAGRADEELAACLKDVVKTPVSPELLPTKDGELVQKTEETVGPYELNDFFLYHYLEKSMPLFAVYEWTVAAFESKYSKEYILERLKYFVKRFHQQQFKRSCLPDGAQVTPVSLSPRGGLLLPSDYNPKDLLQELDELDKYLEEE